MDFNQELLDFCLSKQSLSSDVIEAYKKCPRHKFIHHPYPIEVMYGDYPLEIYRDEEFISTISQPSFVLQMIDMLDLRPGHKVLELGAGSGWNAALMSHLVGRTGKIVSIEIIPTLAQETKKTIQEMGFTNILIVQGDGAQGYPPEAPYDRAIFTAGATDLPLAFHEQIKLGGKLLFVLKTHFGDLLLTLVKRLNHFEETSRLLCSFVPMKGQKEATPSDDLDELILAQERIHIYPSPSKGERDSLFSTT